LKNSKKTLYLLRPYGTLAYKGLLFSTNILSLRDCPVRDKILVAESKKQMLKKSRRDEIEFMPDNNNS
jgi:hypothetical protein